MLYYCFYGGPMGQKAEGWTRPIPVYRHHLEIQNYYLPSLVESGLLVNTGLWNHCLSEEFKEWAHEQNVLWVWNDLNNGHYRIEVPLREHAVRTKLVWG